MKKVYFAFLLLCSVITSCNSDKEWEYKTIQVDGANSFNYYGEDFNSKDIMPTARLNEMASEGWELVTAYPIIETVYPNFGREDYHTGVKSNTRTKAVQYVFKRIKKKDNLQEQ